MRGWLAIALLLVSAGPSSAAIDAVNIYEPRTFGYFLGDTLERQVEVITSGDTELFTAALPRPGPLTYWLDLVAIEHKERKANGQRIYDITLKYQIFYSALEAKKLDIPAIPLRFRNPNGSVADADLPSEPTDTEAGRYTASVPALGVVISPLREIVVSDLMSEKSNEISDIMRPDAQAREISMAPKVRLLAASGAALALSGLLLLWHYAVWPFARRAQRPFTQAERQIRRRQLVAQGQASYGELLLILHRAFDQSAGRRVFAADVPEFIATHERFAGLLPKLASFFESSQLYFFSDDRRLAEDRFPLSELTRLASDLARQERAAA
ncbi:nonribosomal peptide synthetase MxaA [Hyphomicrobium sp.]|uniref:nonribosomal peptide synthetase MxaA n=1 Tax=Hyphomicrobium sp. TaxID=82 RepID=UPI002D7729A2|nr:nonribosomal peptide synthetase MxaA [Hyphomicrobium sp.]HET6390656.1 nonribosomal peptide synthetase MxaA [Hyphomicrobium sp.]